ncbi:Lysosomal trafficking regulator LYST and related BEACH and WD40 repeat proteins [Plasmopara halstedii]|uniref:Lysosomal trafficking regulator LYST and related BEACH and WD40 repeat proteins n=1 Tax=Plasmopara halstedii TaxID=4781 RepID=A0A0P1AHA7_PLAHL|nr:Lysosomal trafficking regulator LYST and related BEACH and WD40 repeat proteins [Plasmopara halstedii]CEG40584.1 Lysosomal trafficking regulator LYST and related BEACH and WD40 repeat proteins [Plasmopara halstedii]|eukprot:XP_024576953.1 Lysosomal trafficking regulator LYST and related BEACH and WD40 repeat proteins [Plasmopara halstedii]
MFASKSSYKSSQTRFNLLLLEDGEFFLDDFSVHRYLEPHPDAHRKVQGRLKTGTRGFFFEPQDSNLPILRFFFRDMKEMPLAELHNNSETGDCAILLAFKISSVVEMKERGVDHPYVQKETNASTGIPEKYMFSLLHSKIEEFLKNVRPIWELAHKKNVMNKMDEEVMLEPILTLRQIDQFDSSLLVDFRERPLLTKGRLVDRIVPLLKYPGCLMLTNQRLYFQPAQVNNVGDPVLNWAYDTIEYLYKRRHMLRQTGLEIFLKNGESFFFSFRNHYDRDEVYDMMVNQPNLKRLQQTDIESMLRKWQQREVSNYDYLVYLNNAAGRTQNDLTQYPVFPWILNDYQSPSIDLSDPAVYRDLSRPIGALNEERLQFYKARYEAMPRGMEHEGLPPPFLYGTHYSTPGYVLYYFVRMAPEYMLCLQNGKFDAPDRLFQSIPSTWSSCNTNHADLKELVPAFFDESLPPDEWLCNGKNLDLGTTQKLTRVGDVELPAWASSPTAFVRMNREALESEYVSEHLHEWIDLIFGYKQRGEAAIDANNLFYYLSYEGSVDLETITDPVEKCSLEAQIQEFGQTPKLLFSEAHPSRNEIGKAVVIATPDLMPSKSSSSSATNNMSVLGKVENRMEEDSVLDENNTSDDDSEEATTANRLGMFAFRTRSFTAVPKQAQRFVGGITAQIRRRMSVESSQRWNWTLGTNGDLSSWEPSAHFMLHSSEVTSLVLGKDGRALFSTSKDSTFKVTATLDGTLRRNLSCNLALSCCDVSNDEKYVFIGSWDNCIYMYSMDIGRVIDQITAHDDGVSAICVFEDRILSSSWDGSIKIWHFTPKGIATAPLLTYMECEESVVKLCISADGLVGAAATRNGIVYLINLRTGELLRKLFASPIHHAEICGLTFCGGTTTVACMTTANELSVYQTDGTRMITISVDADGPIRCFDSDGGYAVGGTSTGKLLFWKLDEPVGREQVLEIPKAHAEGISALIVSPYGTALASASADGGIRIWQLRRKAVPRGRLATFF